MISDKKEENTPLSNKHRGRFDLRSKSLVPEQLALRVMIQNMAPVKQVEMKEAPVIGNQSKQTRYKLHLPTISDLNYTSL